MLLITDIEQALYVVRISAVAEWGPGGVLGPPKFFRNDIVKLDISVL